MAVPTPTITTTQIGQRGVTRFHAVWAATDNFADTVVVDMSALTTYTNTLQCKQLTISASPGLGVLVEYNATTDEILGGVALGGLWFDHDFTKDCDGLETGVPNIGAGTTGDIVVTTTSAAAADELIIIVDWFAT